MNKVLNKIDNKTIEKEFYYLDEDIRDLRKFEDYEELDKKTIELTNKIYKLIPEEYHNMIDEIIEMNSLLTGVEKKYMFKQGVIKGLTDLKYLEEIGQGIILL